MRRIVLASGAYLIAFHLSGLLQFGLVIFTLYQVLMILSDSE